MAAVTVVVVMVFSQLHVLFYSTLCSNCRPPWMLLINMCRLYCAARKLWSQAYSWVSLSTVIRLCKTVVFFCSLINPSSLIISNIHAVDENWTAWTNFFQLSVFYTFCCLLYVTSSLMLIFFYIVRLFFSVFPGFLFPELKLPITSAGNLQLYTVGQKNCTTLFFNNFIKFFFIRIVIGTHIP